MVAPAGAGEMIRKSARKRRVAWSAFAPARRVRRAVPRADDAVDTALPNIRFAAEADFISTRHWTLP
jgi:hypothetical protein